MEFGYFQGRLTQTGFACEDPARPVLKMMTVVNSEGSIVNFIVTPTLTLSIM